ncbi:uncharacterized protein LOC143251985 isoform X2 [Tachypleus tridentatus]|uniref:uncharacterized protein LOC143251985 isoform X2 n=1 Tax=Tachypleus tridentatus TaxID=6853 RepID=UPI003FD451F4
MNPPFIHNFLELRPKVTARKSCSSPFSYRQYWSSKKSIILNNPDIYCGETDLNLKNSCDDSVTDLNSHFISTVCAHKSVNSFPNNEDLTHSVKQECLMENKSNPNQECKNVKGCEPSFQDRNSNNLPNENILSRASSENQLCQLQKGNLFPRFLKQTQEDGSLFENADFSAQDFLSVKNKIITGKEHGDSNSVCELECNKNEEGLCHTIGSFGGYEESIEENTTTKKEALVKPFRSLVTQEIKKELLVMKSENKNFSFHSRENNGILTKPLKRMPFIHSKSRSSEVPVVKIKPMMRINVVKQDDFTSTKEGSMSETVPAFTCSSLSSLKVKSKQEFVHDYKCYENVMTGNVPRKSKITTARSSERLKKKKLGSQRLSFLYQKHSGYRELPLQKTKYLLTSDTKENVGMLQKKKQNHRNKNVASNSGFQFVKKSFHKRQVSHPLKYFNNKTRRNCFRRKSTNRKHSDNNIKTFSVSSHPGSSFDSEDKSDTITEIQRHSSENKPECSVFAAESLSSCIAMPKEENEEELTDSLSRHNLEKCCSLSENTSNVCLHDNIQSIPASPEEKDMPELLPIPFDDTVENIAPLSPEMPLLIPFTSEHEEPPALSLEESKINISSEEIFTKSDLDTFMFNSNSSKKLSASFLSSTPCSSLSVTKKMGSQETNRSFYIKNEYCTKPIPKRTARKSFPRKYMCQDSVVQNTNLKRHSLFQPVVLVERITPEELYISSSYSFSDSSVQNMSCHEKLHTNHSLFSEKMKETGILKGWKEPEMDIIDGVEFLGFKNEEDVTKYTLTFCDWLNDNELSFRVEEDRQSVTSGHTINKDFIIPTKTKDITKIKGWKKKVFLRKVEGMFNSIESNENKNSEDRFCDGKKISPTHKQNDVSHNSTLNSVVLKYKNNYKILADVAKFALSPLVIFSEKVSSKSTNSEKVVNSLDSIENRSLHTVFVSGLLEEFLDTKAELKVGLLAHISSVTLLPPTASVLSMGSLKKDKSVRTKQSYAAELLKNSESQCNNNVLESLEEKDDQNYEKENDNILPSELNFELYERTLFDGLYRNPAERLNVNRKYLGSIAENTSKKNKRDFIPVSKTKLKKPETEVCVNGIGLLGVNASHKSVTPLIRHTLCTDRILNEVELNKLAENLSSDNHSRYGSENISCFFPIISEESAEQALSSLNFSVMSNTSEGMQSSKEVNFKNRLAFHSKTQKMDSLKKCFRKTFSKLDKKDTWKISKYNTVKKNQLGSKRLFPRRKKSTVRTIHLENNESNSLYSLRSLKSRKKAIQTNIGNAKKSQKLLIKRNSRVNNHNTRHSQPLKFKKKDNHEVEAQNVLVESSPRSRRCIRLPARYLDSALLVANSGPWVAPAISQSPNENQRKRSIKRGFEQDEFSQEKVSCKLASSPHSPLVNKLNVKKSRSANHGEDFGTFKSDVDTIEGHQTVDESMFVQNRSLSDRKRAEKCSNTKSLMSDSANKELSYLSCVSSSVTTADSTGKKVRNIKQSTEMDKMKHFSVKLKNKEPQEGIKIERINEGIKEAVEEQSTIKAKIDCSTISNRVNYPEKIKFCLADKVINGLNVASEISLLGSSSETKNVCDNNLNTLNRRDLLNKLETQSVDQNKKLPEDHKAKTNSEQIINPEVKIPTKNVETHQKPSIAQSLQQGKPMTLNIVVGNRTVSMVVFPTNSMVFQQAGKPESLPVSSSRIMLTPGSTHPNPTRFPASQNIQGTNGSFTVPLLTRTVTLCSKTSNQLTYSLVSSSGAHSAVSNQKSNILQGVTDAKLNLSKSSITSSASVKRTVSSTKVIHSVTTPLTFLDSSLQQYQVNVSSTLKNLSEKPFEKLSIESRTPSAVSHCVSQTINNIRFASPNSFTVGVTSTLPKQLLKVVSNTKCKMSVNSEPEVKTTNISPVVRPNLSSVVSVNKNVIHVSSPVMLKIAGSFVLAYPIKGPASASVSLTSTDNGPVTTVVGVASKGQVEKNSSQVSPSFYIANGVKKSDSKLHNPSNFDKDIVKKKNYTHTIVPSQGDSLLKRSLSGTNSVSKNINSLTRNDFEQKKSIPLLENSSNLLEKLNPSTEGFVTSNDTEIKINNEVGNQTKNLNNLNEDTCQQKKETSYVFAKTTNVNGNENHRKIYFENEDMIMEHIKHSTDPTRKKIFGKKNLKEGHFSIECQNKTSRSDSLDHSYVVSEKPEPVVSEETVDFNHNFPDQPLDTFEKDIDESESLMESYSLQDVEQIPLENCTSNNWIKTKLTLKEQRSDDASQSASEKDIEDFPSYRTLQERERRKQLSHLCTILKAHFPEAFQKSNFTRNEVLHLATQYVGVLEKYGNNLSAVKCKLLKDRDILLSRFWNLVKDLPPSQRKSIIRCVTERVQKAREEAGLKDTRVIGRKFKLSQPYIPSKCTTSQSLEPHYTAEYNSLKESAGNIGKIVLRFTQEKASDGSGPSFGKVDLNKVAEAAKKLIGPCVIRRVKLKDGKTVYAYRPHTDGESSMYSFPNVKGISEESSVVRGWCATQPSPLKTGSPLVHHKNSTSSQVFEIPLSEVLCSEKKTPIPVPGENKDFSSPDIHSKISDPDYDKTSVLISEEGEMCFVTKLLPEDELEHAEDDIEISAAQHTKNIEENSCKIKHFSEICKSKEPKKGNKLTEISLCKSTYPENSMTDYAVRSEASPARNEALPTIVHLETESMDDVSIGQQSNENCSTVSGFEKGGLISSFEVSNISHRQNELTISCEEKNLNMREEDLGRKEIEDIDLSEESKVTDRESKNFSYNDSLPPDASMESNAICIVQSKHDKEFESEGLPAIVSCSSISEQEFQLTLSEGMSVS